MYDPRQGVEAVDRISKWEYRSALLEQQITAVKPDILCLQEASEKSYETDFEWLQKAGYQYAVHPKVSICTIAPNS